VLDPEREPGFDSLAQIALTRPQEEVLGDLLRDGAGSPQTPPLALSQRPADGSDVEASVQQEALILCQDHRQTQVRRDRLPIDPRVLHPLTRLAGGRVGVPRQQHVGAGGRRQMSQCQDRADRGQGDEGSAGEDEKSEAAKPPRSLPG
jgi:hypothetical protein